MVISDNLAFIDQTTVVVVKIFGLLYHYPTFPLSDSQCTQCTHTLSLSLSLTHTHTHTFSLSLSLTHTHTLSLSLSLSPPPPLSLWAWPEGVVHEGRRGRRLWSGPLRPAHTPSSDCRPTVLCLHTALKARTHR